MSKKTQKSKNKSRNDALIDGWSIVHLVTSAVLTLFFGPLAALVVTTVWEPIEILVLSPILARFGITFGYESLKNSISDIVFNLAGVILGVYMS